MSVVITSLGSIEVGLRAPAKEGSVRATWSGLLTPTGGSPLRAEGLALSDSTAWSDLRRGKTTVRIHHDESATPAEINEISVAVLAGLENSLPPGDPLLVAAFADSRRERIEDLYERLEQAQASVATIRAAIIRQRGLLWH